MDNSDNLFKIADDAIIKASKYLLKSFGKPKKFTHKHDHHYGIKEDIESHKIYVSEFKKHSPEVGIFSEEGQQDLSKELVWVIDPIEGTSNYRVGNPFWATQVCLLWRHEPILSIIQAPVLNMKFTAQKGKGTKSNKKRIHVSTTSELQMSLVSIGKGVKQEHSLWYGQIVPKVMEKVRTFRHFGACGLEMCLTATGMIDIYINKGSNNIYDYAPGSLIVKEAGGVVTDFDGSNWNINKNEIIASNSSLNKKIIKVV